MKGYCRSVHVQSDFVRLIRGRCAEYFLSGNARCIKKRGYSGIVILVPGSCFHFTIFLLNMFSLLLCKHFFNGKMVNIESVNEQFQYPERMTRQEGAE